jgi:hypothetical protein
MTPKLIILTAMRDSTTYPTTPAGWQDLMLTARINGWEPQDTILDFRYQCDLVVSECDEELDFIDEARLTKKVRKQCGTWPGCYLVPRGQIVTSDDARNMLQALEGTPVDPIFREFLALGPFRIRGQ